MLLLSIDQSTETGSAAILDGQRLVTERRWTETRFSQQPLFPNLKAMLKEAGIESGAIQLYVVGVGPGAYSGLRVALAAAMAMALPGKVAVYGLTSAEGAAWQAAESAQAERVRIVGDARRNQWWTRCFRRHDDYMSPLGDWELVQPCAFKAHEAEVVATSDWARIGALLQAAAIPAGALVPRACLPDAAILGRLALARLAQHIASEPLAPIYLHPAVRVKTDDCQAGGHPV